MFSLFHSPLFMCVLPECKLMCLATGFILKSLPVFSLLIPLIYPAETLQLDHLVVFVTLKNASQAFSAFLYTVYF